MMTQPRLLATSSCLPVAYISYAYGRSKYTEIHFSETELEVLVQRFLDVKKVVSVTVNTASTEESVV